MSNGVYEGDTPPPSIDPTIATNERIARETKHLEERLTRQLAAIENELELRFIAASELSTEKFRKVEQEFELIERQRKEQKEDTKTAVDAALSAQKEAVKEQTAAASLATAKSETATGKQQEQLASTLTTAIEALRRSIDEVKERIAEVDRNARDAAALSDAKTAATISELRSRLDVGPPSLTTLQTRSDENVGRSSEQAVMRERDTARLQAAQARLYGTIGAIVGVGGLLYALIRDATGH